MNINPARPVAQQIVKKPSKAMMAKDAGATQYLKEDLEEIVDEIDLAIGVLRDLLALAKHQLPGIEQSTTKARSAIKAAGRYVDDIETMNNRLYARQAAEQGLVL